MTTTSLADRIRLERRSGFVGREPELARLAAAFVKSLRKKLGPLGSSLETVIGPGYRFRGFPQRPV